MTTSIFDVVPGVPHETYGGFVSLDGKNNELKPDMKVVGDVAIAASETSLFAVPRTMRLEADVAPR